MEGKVYSQSVHNKDCIGCQRHQKDIMVTFLTDKGGEFYDFFLTTHQTEDLIKDLQRQLAYNKLMSSKKWYEKLFTKITEAFYEGRFNRNNGGGLR